MARVAIVKHGWKCPACGREQTEDQRVSRAGPLESEPDRVVCSACGRSSILEFDYAPDVGVSVEVRPVWPS